MSHPVGEVVKLARIRKFAMAPLRPAPKKGGSKVVLPAGEVVKLARIRRLAMAPPLSSLRTPAEIEALRYLGPRLGGRETAEALERSYHSVRVQAQRVGASLHAPRRGVSKVFLPGGQVVKPALAWNRGLVQMPGISPYKGRRFSLEKAIPVTPLRLLGGTS